MDVLIQFEKPGLLLLPCWWLVLCGGCADTASLCDGAVFADPTESSVDAFFDRGEYEDALAGFSCLLTVDFEDVEVTGPEPVAIESDRYLASHFVRIEGDGSQYVHTDFGLPNDFPEAPSGSNLFAPGPIAEGSDQGGFETSVTFLREDTIAGVAAFSVIFVDADRPQQGESGIAVMGRGGNVLAEEVGFSGDNASQIFLGFVARDADGRPGPAIVQVEITSGSEWVGLNEAEDVALDDLSFLEPIPRETGGLQGNGS